MPGLAENLAKAKPMALIVHVADSEACDAAKRAFRHAILPAKTEFTSSDESTPARPTAITHVDDGTETGRLWRKSAARDLHHGLRRGQCVICITTDPRQLPDAVRAHAAATLRLPTPDAWSLKALAQFGSASPRPSPSTRPSPAR